MKSRIFSGRIYFQCFIENFSHYFKKKWYNSSFFLPEKVSDLWIEKLLKFYHHHYIDKAVPGGYKQINEQKTPAMISTKTSV